MNTPPSDQNPPSETDQLVKPAVAAKRSWLPHGCLQWAGVVLLLGVLAGIVLPLFSTKCVMGTQTRALAQAKQIGLALKLFAGDNDGKFPRQGVPVEMTDAPTNSNQAFASLFPTYTQSETIFGNKVSAYQSAKGPDNVLDHPYVWKPVKTLQAGENTYGYVMGLNDERHDAPLVVDGTDGTGHYNLGEHVRGGTWRAKKAIVIHVDNSGSITALRGPSDALYIPRPDDPSKNALETGYLGKDVKYLDPAVARP